MDSSISQLIAERIASQRGSFAALFFQGGLKEGAAQLLSLIDQKGQHHKLHEDHAQILLAWPVIVPEVVTLVFQGVEGFIFDFPARGQPS